MCRHSCRRLPLCSRLDLWEIQESQQDQLPQCLKQPRASPKPKLCGAMFEPFLLLQDVINKPFLPVAAKELSIPQVLS